MKKKIFLKTAIILLIAGALTGCGSKEAEDSSSLDNIQVVAGDEAMADTGEESRGEVEEENVERKGSISIVASKTPHGELLEQVKPILAAKGWELEVTILEDSMDPNQAVVNAEFDANYVQSASELEEYQKEETNLTNVGVIHYEPFGIYPGTEKELLEISQDGIIAVDDNVESIGRTLLLLEEQGLITLKEGIGLNATISDIENNPKNIQIKTMEAKEEAAFLALDGKAAKEAGFFAANDALACETEDSIGAKSYGSIIAVKAGNEDMEGIKELIEALKSEKIRLFIESTYGGNVILSQ